MKTIPRLWAIQGISWLMAISGIVFPVVARLEGKKPEHWPLLIMFAGIVGLFIHGELKSMDKRITDIENSKKEPGEHAGGG